MGDASAKTPGEHGETGESEKVMSKEEQKQLFEEWREDYAARREIDRRERAAGLPQHPWLSEAARANRGKQPENSQDHGNGMDR